MDEILASIFRKELLILAIVGLLLLAFADVGSRGDRNSPKQNLTTTDNP